MTDQRLVLIMEDKQSRLDVSDVLMLDETCKLRW